MSDGPFPAPLTPAVLAAALDGIHPRYGFDPALTGPDWITWPELPGRVGGWAAELTAEGRAPSEVAMSLLSGLTGPVLRPVALGSVLFGRVPRVTADTAAVRRRGRITDRAVLTGPLTTPADLGPRIADLCVPLVDALHAGTRFGRRNLWGAVADILTSHSLWAGRHRGDPEPTLRALFDRTQALLDEAQLHAGVRFPRPTPYPVVESLTHVRGTCCLHYRIPGRTHPDGSVRYCSTCPLQDEQTLHTRLTAFVQGPEKRTHLAR